MDTPDAKSTTRKHRRALSTFARRYLEAFDAHLRARPWHQGELEATRDEMDRWFALMMGAPKRQSLDYDL